MNFTIFIFSLFLCNKKNTFNNVLNNIFNHNKDSKNVKLTKFLILYFFILLALLILIIKTNNKNQINLTTNLNNNNNSDLSNNNNNFNLNNNNNNANLSDKNNSNNSNIKNLEFKFTTVQTKEGEIIPELKNLLENAKKRVTIIMWKIADNDNQHVKTILDNLKKEVEVTLIYEIIQNLNLLDDKIKDIKKIKIRAFHTKIILIDDLIWVGSYNILLTWSAYDNYVTFKDQSISDQIHEYYVNQKFDNPLIFKFNNFYLQTIPNTEASYLSAENKVLEILRSLTEVEHIYLFQFHPLENEKIIDQLKKMVNIDNITIYCSKNEKKELKQPSEKLKTNFKSYTNQHSKMIIIRTTTKTHVISGSWHFNHQYRHEALIYFNDNNAQIAKNINDTYQDDRFKI